ncbi:hypothetical protein ALT785_370030 [Alteromonas infernus]
MVGFFVSAFYTFDNTYLLTLLGNLELVQKRKTGNAVIKYDKRRLQRKVGFWCIQGSTFRNINKANLRLQQIKP